MDFEKRWNELNQLVDEYHDLDMAMIKKAREYAENCRKYGCSKVTFVSIEKGR